MSIQLRSRVLSHLNARSLLIIGFVTIKCRLQMFDPDWYGLYRGFVSPENNNFATDFMRVPILTAVGLVAGPAGLPRALPVGHAHGSVNTDVQRGGGKPPRPPPPPPPPPPQQHPCAATFVTLVQQALQVDLFHSITMPSGATQEAPGCVMVSMHVLTRPTVLINNISLWHSTSIVLLSKKKTLGLVNSQAH